MNVLRADARSASQADRQKRQTSSLFRAFKFRSRNCWQPKLAADVAVPPTHTLGLPEIAAVCETQPADIFALTKLEPAWVWNKIAGKRDPALEESIKQWMGAILGQPLPNGDFGDILRDGTILCQ
ncbi:hypothetical protein HPB48_022905 [Haemaphysalis longicornis]|uniref:Calponin-homology (CH) domain-containing protein n=1 Tax=Haemaphysalis longicornis TaxID=44386 RepID=A0A9J6H330_HAELO|nr:hypothetical protein HPB48_022905 [Haemaphysalis longicornis]